MANSRAKDGTGELSDRRARIPMTAPVPVDLQVFRPAPHILAFYAGRPDSPYASPRNWQEMGYALGTCSYAIVSGDEALIYDTQLSIAHAQMVRRCVAAEGAKRIRVVLSHHHTDHVAGNAVFEDCPILANTATERAMRTVRSELEAGEPPIRPLVMPTETFADDMLLKVGDLSVSLLSFNIHSHDGLVLWLAEQQILLAGDTLEDPVTFVCEPEGLPHHLTELERLAQLPISRILPNHGDPSRIAKGGYAPSLIEATQRYIRWLLACKTHAAELELTNCLANDFAAGTLIHHPSYEAIHRGNIAAVLASARDA